MNVYEFGNRENPIIMLFPGTLCYRKGNFGHVIDELSKHFFVAAVAYTGFDEKDTESYVSFEDELGRIEKYVNDNYGCSICAAYGCSLGGSFAAQLTARHRIHIKYSIIGSSDMDQSGKITADIMAALMVKLTFLYIRADIDRTLCKSALNKKWQTPIHITVLSYQ